MKLTKVRVQNYRSVEDSGEFEIGEGAAWEILITGARWFDVRAGKGGGGGVDLVMHLLGVKFVEAVKILSAQAGSRRGDKQE